MSKERKMYRKSPGRQYGYDYDPLNNQSERGPREDIPNKPNAQLVQRPDLRRTRQLMRQNILASKGRTPTGVVDSEEFNELYQEEQPLIDNEQSELQEQEESEEPEDPTFYSRRRSGRFAQPRLPSTRQLMPDDVDANEWQNLRDVNPDLDYEDQELDSPDIRMGYTEMQPAPRSVRTRHLEPEEYEDDYDDEYDEYEDEYEDPPQPRRRRKTRKLSRRGLLLGIGAVAVGGAGVAAYELVPKIPQAVGNATANIEKQLEDAFNKGVAQGAENARKELLTALENIEGFTLDGAISAAKLTRIAYDVFVSPIVKEGSTLTGDFLNTMLRAFRTARGWLAGAYLDNPTLIAIQKVLEEWVNQITSLPKKLDSVTQTDLEGAQAYLRALQNKINTEKAKLNTNGTPTTPKTK